MPPRTAKTSIIRDVGYCLFGLAAALHGIEAVIRLLM